MKLSDTEDLIACVDKKVAKKIKDFSSLRSAMYTETRLTELCLSGNVLQHMWTTTSSSVRKKLSVI